VCFDRRFSFRARSLHSTGRILLGRCKSV
jgi:hypothetical protein